MDSKNLLAHGILSKEQGLRLVSILNNGESPEEKQKAREELFFSNLRLVRAIAMRYQGHNMFLEDLEGAGRIGLFMAIDKADAEKMKEKNSSFATYAEWWIRQAIKQFLVTGGLLKTPGREYWDAVKLYFELMDAGNEETGVTYEQAVLLGAINPIVSLNIPLVEGGEMSDWIDVLCDPATLPGCSADIEALITEDDRQAKLKKAVRELLSRRLNSRERRIITLRYGLEGDEPESLQEVAEILNLSKERVRQIQKEAEKKLGKRRFLFEASLLT